MTQSGDINEHVIGAVLSRVCVCVCAYMCVQGGEVSLTCVSYLVESLHNHLHLFSDL